jgi:hypothetical protein
MQKPRMLWLLMREEDIMQGVCVEGDDTCQVLLKMLRAKCTSSIMTSGGIPPILHSCIADSWAFRETNEVSEG